VLVAACTLGLALPAAAQSSYDRVADEIIGIVKAQWAATKQKNLAEAMKNVADDYTEFNSDFATRIEGKELVMRVEEGWLKGSGDVLVSEMINPKVQVYGDVAILSYNYVGVSKDKDGETEPARAKSTRVYARQGGKWMLVHANFGADPLPE
jgi:ketosteroid isomerase-like protein